MAGASSRGHLSCSACVPPAQCAEPLTEGRRSAPRPAPLAQEGVIVKDRCEPCQIVSVLQVVSAARGGAAAEAEVAAAAYANSVRMFRLEP